MNIISVDIILRIKGRGEIDTRLNQMNQKVKQQKSELKNLGAEHDATIADLEADRQVSRTELDTLELEYDNFEREAKARRTMMWSLVKTLSVRAFALINQTINLFGITLPPVLNATVRLLFTLWEQYQVVIASESALAAAPYQQWRWITVGLAITSAILSLAGAVKQQVAAEQMNRQIAEAKRNVSGGIGGITSRITVIL